MCVFKRTSNITSIKVSWVWGGVTGTREKLDSERNLEILTERTHSKAKFGSD